MLSKEFLARVFRRHKTFSDMSVTEHILINALTQPLLLLFPLGSHQPYTRLPVGLQQLQAYQKPA